MASYANSLNDFLKRQPPAPTNFGTSGPTPIESPVPRVPFPEGPTLRNAAPGGAPPVAGTPTPVSGPSPGPTVANAQGFQEALNAEKSALSAKAAEANIARRFAAANAGEAARAFPGYGADAQKPGTAPSWQSTVGAAALIAPGAWHTGAEIKDRTADGQGFWSAVGDTIKGNVNRSLRATSPTAGAILDAKSAGADPMALDRRSLGQIMTGRGASPVDSRDIVAAGARDFRERPVSAPAVTDSDMREPPTPLEAGYQAITPRLTSLGNGYGVSGANTSGRAGYSQRTYYDPSGNVVGSGLSSATGRGGFVGAATDAQAERNQRARMEQDAAAGANAASMNRAAAAMRDLRAAQVADKDGYERQTGLSSMLAPSAPAERTDPLSLPGDSFQDTRGRRAEFDRLREQATSGSRRERASAQAGLSALMGLAGANAPNGRSGSDAAGDDRLRTLLNQRERDIDNARSQANADRSYDLQAAQFRATQEQNRFNQGHQVWQADRQLRQDEIGRGDKLDDRVRDDERKFIEDRKGGVDIAGLKAFGRELGVNSELKQLDPQFAQRIRDGLYTYADLASLEKAKQLQAEYGPKWWNAWFRSRPTTTETVQRMYAQ